MFASAGVSQGFNDIHVHNHNWMDKETHKWFEQVLLYKLGQGHCASLETGADVVVVKFLETSPLERDILQTLQWRTVALDRAITCTIVECN